MKFRDGGTLFRDRHGLLRMGWELAAILGGVVAVTAVLGVAFFFALKPLNEASCNQTAAQYHVDGDYRVLSDSCWLTTSDGTVVAADRFRQWEAVHGVGGKN